MLDVGHLIEIPPCFLFCPGHWGGGCPPPCLRQCKRHCYRYVMPWPRVRLCVCQSVISGCSIQTLTDRAGVLARSLSSTCPTQFRKEIQCRNNGTFSGTVFQTPKYRLIYLLQSAVCVDIDGIFTRTLKLCWHCRADND